MASATNCLPHLKVDVIDARGGLAHDCVPMEPSHRASVGDSNHLKRLCPRRIGSPRSHEGLDGLAFFGEDHSCGGGAHRSLERGGGLTDRPYAAGHSLAGAMI